MCSWLYKIFLIICDIFSEYEAMTSVLLTRRTASNNCFVIQPYVKWGPSKSDESPELKLSEAVALVNSIPEWSVAHKVR